LYELIQWKLHTKKNKFIFKAFVQKTLIQVCISSLWFFWMYYTYKNEFIQYHFIDSHFKRVTASIEQHFGQRTFYIDLLLEQMKYGIVPALVSISLLIYWFIKSKKEEAFFSLIFIPWFLFLNLTKTKIAWYLYPVLPQFVYLTVYMLRYIKKQWIQGLVTIGILWYFFTTMIPITSYITSDYSNWEDHQLIAQDTQKAGCKTLFVLVNESTRSSYKTLKSMDLVIHTTTWWGNHPSMAYYSNAKTVYIYTADEFQSTINNSSTNTCFTAEKKDWSNEYEMRILSKNNTFILGVKE